jgi:hypothetical protein
MADNKQKIEIESKTNVGAVVAVVTSILAVLAGAFLIVIGVIG